MKSDAAIALVVSHPIQYFAHRYRYLETLPGLKAKVFFGSRKGLEPYYDKEFGRTFAWKMPLLTGYECAFPDPGKLGRELTAFRPSCIWIHGYFASITRSAWRWARSSRVPVFMSGDSNIVRDLPKPFFFRLMKQVILRPFFSTIRGFLTVGERNEAWYRYYGVPSSKMIRVPFTVDPAIFEPIRLRAAACRMQLREKYGIPPDAFTALWCGKMTSEKRPLDFVEALKINQRKGGPGIYALFVGDGAMRQEVERAVNEARLSAVFAGFFNVDEMPQAYAAADVLVHTRQHEPYGLVAVEAAALGLPMIVPCSMGAVGRTDAARPGENAIAFQDGNVAELGAHLSMLGRETALRERMRHASETVYRDIKAQFEAGIDGLVGRAGEAGPLT